MFVINDKKILISYLIEWNQYFNNNLISFIVIIINTKYLNEYMIQTIFSKLSIKSWFFSFQSIDSGLNPKNIDTFDKYVK